MVRIGIKTAIISITALLVAELGMMAYYRWFAEGAVPDRELYPVRGIDISHHNGMIDFSRVAKADADVSFVYIKATEAPTSSTRRLSATRAGPWPRGYPPGHTISSATTPTGSCRP